MSKVLVIGVSVLDFIFHMQEFPLSPEKYRASDAIISGGGNAANSAVAIARLGGIPQLATRLGDDEIADLIVAGLNKENIDTGLVHRYRKNRSSFSSIYIDQTGERQIMNYRDESLPEDAAWVAADIRSPINAVLADTRWPEGACMGMELARKFAVPGIIDAEAPLDGSQDALITATHVAFSAQGAADFTGDNDVESAALKADAALPGKIIITDGHNGTVMIENKQPVWIKAFPVNAIDTLGAGDVWHGAFALALGEGCREAKAIRFANAAAAIKCTRKGGRDGAPTRDEVSRFISSLAEDN